MDIDVVGFSRGAAEARVWINQLFAKQDNGTYTYTANGKPRCVNLRFEALVGYGAAPTADCLNI